MEFSRDAQFILSAVDQLAKGKLNFREDLGRLIDLSIQNKRIDVLEDLSFQTKYSQGLLKIVQNRGNKIDDQYFTQIQKEFAESIQKISSLIQLILSSSPEFIKQIFTEKYLQTSHSSLSNLNKLCSDLGFLKLYFNDLKRK
ncbi:MAG: hypothetical protein AB1432_05060 [Bacteroidota bacterium]|jgi:hypothetical protein